MLSKDAEKLHYFSVFMRHRGASVLGRRKKFVKNMLRAGKNCVLQKGRAGWNVLKKVQIWLV